MNAFGKRPEGDTAPESENDGNDNGDDGGDLRGEHSGVPTGVAIGEPSAELGLDQFQL